MGDTNEGQRKNCNNFISIVVICGKQLVTTIKCLFMVFYCNCGNVVMLFKQPFRSVYKELHADRETGC